MSTRAADIESKVAEEVSRISEPALAARIRGLLVPVRCEPRGWDYGTEGQMFPCWIVAEYPSSNTAFGYCEYGFGPSFPWGLHSISGAHMTLGMDCGWYASLEDAFRTSWAWDVPNPPGHEVS